MLLEIGNEMRQCESTVRALSDCTADLRGRSAGRIEHVGGLDGLSRWLLSNLITSKNDMQTILSKIQMQTPPPIPYISSLPDDVLRQVFLFYVASDEEHPRYPPDEIMQVSEVRNADSIDNLQAAEIRKRPAIRPDDAGSSDYQRL